MYWRRKRCAWPINALGLSLKALRLRCTRGYGVPPQIHYLHLRLDRARDLLKNTEMTVTEIALATGFGTLPGFSRQFKLRYRHSPRSLRNR